MLVHFIATTFIYLNAFLGPFAILIVTTFIALNTIVILIGTVNKTCITTRYSYKLTLSIANIMLIITTQSVI